MSGTHRRGEDAVRDFLFRIRNAKLDVAYYQRKLDSAFAECQRITAQVGAVGGGSADIHKDGPWAAYADLKKVLEEQHTLATKLEREGEERIALLPDARHRVVLGKRYLEALTWPRVLEEMRALGLYYEERNVYNLRDAAIEELRKIWEEQGYEDSSRPNKDI